MKRFILILFFPFILSATAENLSNADAYPLKFSIDVSNEVLVDVVKKIENDINTASYTKNNKLTVEWQDVDLYDRFYDVPELLLLKNKAQLYQRTFVNQYVTSRKGKKKKTKDNILFISSHDIKSLFKEKKYNKVKEQWGKHPLLGSIKRKERSFLADKLNELKIKTPLRLKNILNLRSVGKKIILKKNNVAILSVNILSHDVDSMESTIQYASVHFESYLKDGELTLVKQISSDLSKRLLNTSPNSKLYYVNHYNHAYSLFSDEVVLFNLKIRHPAVVRLLSSLGWFVFGILLILVFFRKKMFSSPFT